MNGDSHWSIMSIIRQVTCQSHQDRSVELSREWWAVCSRSCYLLVIYLWLSSKQAQCRETKLVEWGVRSSTKTWTITFNIHLLPPCLHNETIKMTLSLLSPLSSLQSLLYSALVLLLPTLEARLRQLHIISRCLSRPLTILLDSYIQTILLIKIVLESLYYIITKYQLNTEKRDKTQK